jgi:HEAT repeat protein
MNNRKRLFVWILAVSWTLLALPAAHGASFDDVYAASGDSAATDAFRRGQAALNDKHWDVAAGIFLEIVEAGDDETGAALYWLAYAQVRGKHYRAARDTLEWLLDDYPSSQWAEDARALDIEVRGKLGEPATPEDEANEELKLYALDGLMSSDSSKALPILEKFLEGDHSMRLKEHALFVLAQSDDPRARQVLRDMARNSQGDLRVSAIEVIGLDGTAEDAALLADIYREASDTETKQAVLEAYLVSEQTGQLLDVIRSENDPELRTEAIQVLGAMEAVGELETLYASAASNQEKVVILEAYAITDNTALLVQAARNETDPEVRQQAIHGLGIVGNRETAGILLELYGASTTKQDKETIMEALMIQDAADELIQIYRSESDPELKRDAVQMLSQMDSDQVEAVLMEILED